MPRAGAIVAAIACGVAWLVARRAIAIGRVACRRAGGTSAVAQTRFANSLCADIPPSRRRRAMPAALGCDRARGVPPGWWDIGSRSDTLRELALCRYPAIPAMR